MDFPRKIGQRRIVFSARIGVAVVRFRNRPLDRMQSVVVAVNPFGVLKEVAGCVRLAQTHQCLRGAEIQTEVALRRLCQAHVQVRGFLLLARESVGVSEFSLCVSRLFRNRLEGRDGLIVLSLIAIFPGNRTHNLGIIWGTVLREIQIVGDLFRLPETLVCVSNEQVRVRRCLDHVGAL